MLWSRKHEGLIGGWHHAIGKPGAAIVPPWCFAHSFPRRLSSGRRKDPENIVHGLEGPVLFCAGHRGRLGTSLCVSAYTHTHTNTHNRGDVFLEHALSVHVCCMFCFGACVH